MLGSRDAQHSGTGRVRHAAGAARPGDADQSTRSDFDRGRPATTSPPPPQRLAAAGRGRTGADALDRAPDRPPLRRLPALLPGRPRPRLLAAGGAGRRSSPREAIYQQTETVTVPGLRGSLLDRRGNELAASEDAATIYATPYQVKNPPQAAAKLAPILDLTKSEVLESADRRIGLLLRRPQSRPADGGADRTRWSWKGSAQLPDSRRTYPQGELAGQVIGAVGSENQGLTGLEAGEEDDPRRRPTASGGSSRTRSATRSGWKRSRKPSDGEDIQLTLDPADPGEDRAGAGRSRRSLRAEGGDGDRHGPAQLAGPGDGQLAAGRPQRPLRAPATRTCSTGRPASPTSRARPSRRSPSPRRWRKRLVTPATDVHAAAEHPGRRPRDRGRRTRAATETMSVAEILAHSSNVGAVTIGLEVGAEKFSRWIDRFGFGRPTGVQFPAEEQGLVPDARRILGLDDGQPADRPGPLGDADADDGRLRGDRQRRHPARSRS